MLGIHENRVVLLSIFLLILAVFTIWMEFNSVNSYLVLASSLLLGVIVASIVLFEVNNLISPLVIFSLMYSGYALGGYYYAFSVDSFGKFIDFVALDHDLAVAYMQVGLLYALLCYLCFVFGYLLVKKNLIFLRKNSQTDFQYFLIKISRLLVPVLLFLGLVYWYWVGVQTSGSFLDMFRYFQAFPHLARDSGISTLPYHLYYAGVFLWLLVIAVQNKKIGWLFIVFSILGMVMNATQGRIALSITFLMAQIIFIALYNKELKGKIIVISVFLVAFAFILYYLRILSNSVFIGASLDIYELNFLKVMIGGGNVSDLQQLVLIFYTFNLEGSLLGATYFDWIRNSFGGLLGLEPSSVGLTIKELHIPATSGAPTPGAIGEAYANFNVLAPLFMFGVGSFFAAISNTVLHSRNLIVLLVYSIFLARFVFIYPKVDSTMMSNFFWGAFPLILLLFVLFIGFKLVKR